MPVSLVMVLSENMVTMANMEYKKRYYLYPHPYVHLGGYIPIDTPRHLVRRVLSRRLAVGSVGMWPIEPNSCTYK